MSKKSIDVVVEIPAGGRNKYEYDHEKHIIRLDRRLSSTNVYPADYGFIPDTLAEDGDPLDVLVLLDEPTFPGCWIEVRPVGLFQMSDEKGPDAKIICVAKADTRRQNIQDIDDLPKHFLEEVEHFFKVYKDLEPGKVSNPQGYENKEAAWAEIEECLARYKQ